MVTRFVLDKESFIKLHSNILYEESNSPLLMFSEQCMKIQESIMIAPHLWNITCWARYTVEGWDLKHQIEVESRTLIDLSIKVS